MKFERIKKSHKKEIIIGGLIVLGIVSAITITTSRAKYRLTQSIPIVRGTVNYKPYDFKIMAMYKQKDGSTCTEDSCYDEITDRMPSSGYAINENKSYCTLNNETDTEAKLYTNSSGEHIFKNLKKNEKCYVWFDTLETEKPTINNIEETVTKTEINVTVSASDNIGVTEYWYAVDSDNYAKGRTGNTYKFSGLASGSTHTIKVYVKDAAGNESDVFTKSIVTTPENVTQLITTLNAKTTVPDFSTLAEADEGVFKVTDEMYTGDSYYWRGAVTNNHVIFADKCWRMIRINGDSTIRLIYNGDKLTGDTCTGNGVSNPGSIAISGHLYYNGKLTYTSTVGWTYAGSSQRPSNNATATASNAKADIETWFNNNITGTNLSKVADGKFCNDRSVTSGTWRSSGSDVDYAGKTRLQTNTNKEPTLACPTGDVYTLKVGLITADEVAYAGGKYFTVNKFFYLYNGQHYWTMTPYGSTYNTSTTTNNTRMWAVSSNGVNTGALYYRPLSNSTGAAGLRPVINLNKNITFSSGNGTQNNPYIVQ